MVKGVVPIISCVLLSFTCVYSQNPKVIADCTIQYDLSIEDAKADPGFVNSMKGAIKTVYIKGTRSRSDLVSTSFTQTTLNDTRSDTTIVLKELGNVKYMSFLNEQKRQQQNKKFEGITFAPSGETKTILGYECTKAVAKLKDGSALNVYYAPSVTLSNKEYEYQFRNISGLVLEYETQSEDGKSKIKYTATKITLTPVPESKFDVPKSGYRLL